MEVFLSIHLKFFAVCKINAKEFIGKTPFFPSIYSYPVYKTG